MTPLSVRNEWASGPESRGREIIDGRAGDGPQKKGRECKNTEYKQARKRRGGVQLFLDDTTEQETRRKWYGGRGKSNGGGDTVRE